MANWHVVSILDFQLGREHETRRLRIGSHVRPAGHLVEDGTDDAAVQDARIALEMFWRRVSRFDRSGARLVDVQVQADRDSPYRI